MPAAVARHWRLEANCCCYSDHWPASAANCLAEPRRTASGRDPTLATRPAADRAAATTPDSAATAHCVATTAHPLAAQWVGTVGRGTGGGGTLLLRTAGAAAGAAGSVAADAAEGSTSGLTTAKSSRDTTSIVHCLQRNICWPSDVTAVRRFSLWHDVHASRGDNLGDNGVTGAAAAAALTGGGKEIGGAGAGADGASEVGAGGRRMAECE
jgi:hypothetical protein